MKKVITLILTILIIFYSAFSSFAVPNKNFNIKDYEDLKSYYIAEYGDFSEYVIGYDEGYEQGYEDGSVAEEDVYDENYDEGWKDGYEQAKEEYSVFDEEEANSSSTNDIGSIVAAVVVGGILIIFIGAWILIPIIEKIKNKK